MKLPWHNESEPIKHFNCRSSIGSFQTFSSLPIIPLDRKTLKYIISLLYTDDEKIDYYESKRIFKLYGVEKDE